MKTAFWDGCGRVSGAGLGKGTAPTGACPIHAAAAGAQEYNGNALDKQTGTALAFPAQAAVEETPMSRWA